MNLRFASIEELDATVTARRLVKVADRFPKATLSLTSGASHENHDALSSRAADMTLAVDTVAKVDWVERHPILRDPFILVTAKGADQANGPMIRYELEPPIGHQIEAQLRRTGPVPARGFAFSTNQALFAMTAELGALGDLPRIIAADLRDCIADRVIPDAEARLEILGDEMQIIQESQNNHFVTFYPIASTPVFWCSDSKQETAP